MFTELQLSGELRLRLAGAVVNGACIDQAGMSLALRLTTRAELGDAELEELKHLLMGVYGFRQVTTEVTCKAPSSQAAAAGSRPAASVPAAPSGSKGEKQAAGKVLMGKPIRIQPVPMKILDLKMGNATVAGKVFAFECRETRRPGMWRLSFDMTDYTNSVTVQKNLTEKEAQGLESAIKPGMWLCVQGKMEPTWDGKDIQLNPYHIQLAEHTERQDTAPEKRVDGCPDGHERGGPTGYPVGTSRHRHHGPRRGPVLPGRLARRWGQDQDPLWRGGLLCQQHR